MAGRTGNMQMFALRKKPPRRLRICGTIYHLERVFKHDFYAATCLYGAVGPAGEGAPRAAAKVVVKFGRTQDFCGLPMAWLGRFNCRHEQAIYKALAGVQGIPRWIGRVGRSGCAIEYIDARPLDHQPPPPPGFFDRLAGLIEALHARGVAYGDTNKRSNILIGPGGQPFLIDFQLSVQRRDHWPWPLRAVAASAVNYLRGRDLYHLYKHKRRMSPAELTTQEELLSRHRSGLHALHRKLTKPYRSIRRWFLNRQYRKGQLVSPTADLEDHDQPEKQSWRKTKGAGP